MHMNIGRVELLAQIVIQKVMLDAINGSFCFMICIASCAQDM